MRTDKSFDPARRVLSSATATDEQRAAALDDLETRTLSEEELRDRFVDAYPAEVPTPHHLEARAWFIIILAICAGLLVWAAYEIIMAATRLSAELEEVRAVAAMLRAM